MSTKEILQHLAEGGELYEGEPWHCLDILMVVKASSINDEDKLQLIANSIDKYSYEELNERLSPEFKSLSEENKELKATIENLEYEIAINSEDDL